MKRHFFVTCVGSSAAPDDLSSLVAKGADWNDRISRRELPSQPDLAKMFDYDSTSGSLIWRSREGNGTFNRLWAGKPAGYLSKRGYWQITIQGAHYWSHRLIWKLLRGTDPREIDHINGDKSDNRIENLRDVDRSANSRNVSRDPGSGQVGVFFARRGRRWTAQIQVEGKARHLGNFVTKAEAIAARKGAERALGYYDL